MLEELNALLEAANDLPEQPETGVYEVIPDGVYEAIIKDVSFKETKTTKKLMFSWHFVITAGNFTNRHEWKNEVLSDPTKMKALVTELRKFGINTEKGIDEINNQLDNLIDVPVILTIETSVPKDSTKNPWRNISISKE